MKEHFSCSGTTCWFCGHPAGAGNRMRKLGGAVLYMACKDCHHAPAGEEASRRDADVEGLKTMLAGGTHAPQYFTQGNFASRVAEFRGYAPEFLDALKAKPYADAFAKDTQARVEVAETEYRKNYREGRKEQLYKQYHEGGGKERAAERYRERKGGGDPKPPKAPPTLEEIEARKAKARAYSKDWYRRKVKGPAILVSTEFNNEGSGI